MTKQERENLKKLVGDGKIEKATNKLLQYILEKDERNELVATQAKYNSLEKEIRLGTLSAEDQNLRRNNINTALLNQIDIVYDYLKEGDTQVGNEIATGSKGEKNWIIILGVIGSLASIISLICFFYPKPDVEQLTVFVTDAKGIVVLEKEGELNIPLVDRSLNKTIGEDGRTNFGGIPSSYKGDNIKIGLDAEGWLIDGPNTFLFEGKPIKLIVKQDNSLGTIRGSVMTRDGQSFIDSAKITINADTTIYSNKNGLFEIILPQNMRIDKPTKQYRLTVSKEGYQTETQLCGVKSSPAEIRLIKLK